MIYKQEGKTADWCDTNDNQDEDDVNTDVPNGGDAENNNKKS